MSNSQDVATQLAVLASEVGALRLSVDAQIAFQKERVADIQKDVTDHGNRIDILEKRSERQLGYGAALVFLGGVLAWVIDHWDKIFSHR